MKLKACTVAMAIVLGAPPAIAQIEYDTSQLQQRADVERNRILVESTMRQKQRWDAGRGVSGRTRAQAVACASRARFRREYGANNPKVRRLESLCSRAGY